MIVKAGRFVNILLANSDGENCRFSSEGLLLAWYLHFIRPLQIPGCRGLPGTCRVRKSLNVFDRLLVVVLNQQDEYEANIAHRPRVLALLHCIGVISIVPE